MRTVKRTIILKAWGDLLGLESVFHAETGKGTIFSSTILVI